MARRVFRIQLEETPSDYLASPMALTVTPRGEFLVTDQFYQRVYHYTRQGRLLKTIGRQGQGPGEFEMIGAAVAISDTILAVLDDTRRSVTFLRLDSGSYLYEVRFDGVASSSASASGDTLTFGLSNPVRRTGLAEVVVGDTTVRYFAQLPSVRVDVAPLAGIHTLIAHDRGQHSTIVGFSGVDSLFELAPTGKPVVVVAIPAIRRRRFHQTAAITFSRPRPFPEFFAATSFLFAVKMLSSRDRAILHMDQDIKGRFISSRPFLTVISESRLVPVFHGDTLLFVTQELQQSRVLTFVEGFAIEASGCQWNKIRP
jgi:hypothetical protein